MKQLFDYQQEIVDKAYPSSALFMEMGTGKTITSLRIAQKYHCYKLLVICLKCKINDWKEEIAAETDFKENEVMVINFESVWRNTKAIDFTDNNTMIIIDESHKIKNPKSKVAQYIRYLKQFTKYKLILTGTPQNQQYVDYWMQLGFLDSEIYNVPFKEFEKKYINYTLDYLNGHYFKRIDSYNHTDLLKYGINQLAFYKNYDSQYEKPIEIITKIERPKEYKELLKNKAYDDIFAENPMTLRNYLREACSGFIKNHDLDKIPKLEWLKEFLEITNHKIVIFVNYNKEVELIKNLCEKLDRPYSIFNGEYKDLTNFKTKDNSICIVNYASGATGINDLCISNIAIFYSLPDGDYILFKQAKARIDRIGQTKQPIFYYLVTEKSIEQAIYNAFKEGDNFTNEMYLNWLENV